MFKVVVGHSNDPDSVEAISEVLEQCLDSLAGEIPQAGILFSAIDFEYSLILQKIYQQFPQLELIGGTTDGEISSQLGFQEDSLTLMLFCSDEIEIYAGVGEKASDDPVVAVQKAIEQAQSKSKNALETSLCLTLVDGLTTSGGTTIVEILQQQLGSKIPIFGGMTFDQSKYQKTYQFCQQEVFSDAIAVLLFSGKLLFSYGIANGWNPIGKKRQVTKVDKNILYEIDHKTALAFYKYYLNDSFPSLQYPLAVFIENSEEFYLRVSNFYDAETGSITFFGDIPKRANVQITEINREAILASSQASMIRALEKYPGTEPAAILLFSCAGRRQVLGTKAEEEYQVLKKYLGQDLPICGFYTAGEIAPLENYKSTVFHCETLITLLLGTK
jgi:hypothetical protein